MLAALGLLIVSARPTPLVAFTARFYSPPGDKSVSRHLVYVSHLDGAHRRLVSSRRYECGTVRWIGNHKLAWIEFSPKENVDPAADSDPPGRLVVYDLRTKARTVVRAAGATVFLPLDAKTISGSWKRGEGLYSCGRLTVSGLKSRPNNDSAESSGDLPDGSDRAWRVPGQPTVYSLGEEGPMITVKEPYGAEVGAAATVYLRSGKRHTFRVPHLPQCFFADRGAKDLSWCLTGDYAGSAGSHEYIYLYNWRTDAARCVVDDLLDIDFRQDSRYYAGATWDKDDSPYGRTKRVWTRDVVTGDIKTGKRWIVAGGLVHATSVSLQPR